MNIENLIQALRTSTVFDDTTIGNEAADVIESLQNSITRRKGQIAAADFAVASLKTERDTIRQQLAEAQALIEASRKQEPTCWVTPDGEGFRLRLSAPVSAVPLGWDALFAAPVVADDVLKDAQRYRWLREQSWMDNMCVVDSPKNSVKLGSFCPSHGRLDVAIDQAMGGAE